MLVQVEEKRRAWEEGLLLGANLSNLFSTEQVASSRQPQNQRSEEEPMPPGVLSVTWGLHSSSGDPHTHPYTQPRRKHPIL